MTLIVWNDCLATGIAAIDRQHRRLVDLVNDVAPVLTEPGAVDPEVLAPLLRALDDYAGTHFRAEEALMAAYGLEPRSLAHHRATHEAFRQTVGMLATAATSGGATGEKLLAFLASWLVIHILGEDQAMARQLRALEGGATTADAYVAAGGTAIDPSPHDLNRVLVDAYTALTRRNRELRTVNAQLEAKGEEIRRQNENLEATVLTRTADLRRLAGDLLRSRDAAEAGSRAKTRFLDAVSHELRTPMNAILGFAHLLGEKVADPAQQRLARGISTAAEELLAMVNGIVEYTGTEEGEPMPAQTRPFALAPLLHAVCAQPFRVAAAKGLHTGIDVDPSLPAWLAGDGDALARVLRQFVDNAVKFTVVGGVALTARRLGAEGAQMIDLQFTVSDTGSGVPPTLRPQLFAPFVQADGGRDRRHDGLGLGLALAQRSATRMGATVGCADRAAPGAEFWLRATLAVAAPPVDTPAGDPAAAREVPLPPVARRCPVGGPPPPALAASLDDLAELMRICDTRAIALFRRLAPALRECVGDEVEAIGRHLDRFQFDRALATLQAVSGPPTSAPTEGP